MCKMLEHLQFCFVSFGFFDVHPVLLVHADFKFSVMRNVFKCVLGIASVC